MLNQKSLDTEILTLIKKQPIRVASKQSDTITVSANAIGTGTVDMTSVVPSGYALIGVAGFGCTASGAIPVSVYRSSGNIVTASFRNVTSASVNQKITIYGLFVRTA